MAGLDLYVRDDVGLLPQHRSRFIHQGDALVILCPPQRSVRGKLREHVVSIPYGAFALGDSLLLRVIHTSLEITLAERFIGHHLLGYRFANA